MSDSDSIDSLFNGSDDDSIDVVMHNIVGCNDREVQNKMLFDVSRADDIHLLKVVCFWKIRKNIWCTTQHKIGDFYL